MHNGNTHRTHLTRLWGPEGSQGLPGSRAARDLDSGCGVGPYLTGVLLLIDDSEGIL